MTIDSQGHAHYEADEDMLPPGPWHAKGNKVMAGGQTVAVVVCPRAAAVAHRIAKTFGGATVAETDREIYKLHAQIKKLESEIDLLESRLDEARAALD